MKRLDRQIGKMSKIFLSYKIKKKNCNYVPSRLWIEPTNNCNLKCVMCLNKDLPKESFGYMDYGLYKKIINEISGKIQDVYLHHRGESLLHPRIFDMISYAKERNINTRLHTNATLLDEEKVAGIIDSKLDFISFSFDSFEKETYENIRKGAAFEKTISNIIEFLKQKQKKQSKNPYTSFTMIDFSSENTPVKIRNDFLKQFSSLPLDSVRVRKPHNWAGDYNTSADASTSMGVRNESGCIKKGLKFNPCTFLWYSLSILWDGTVLPCPQDFFGELKIGNVANDNLLDLWNSENEIKLRTMMDKINYEKLKPCNSCDRIWRKTFLGLPINEIYSFIKDNLLGYK